MHIHYSFLYRKRHLFIVYNQKVFIVFKEKFYNIIKFLADFNGTFLLTFIVTSIYAFYISWKNSLMYNIKIYLRIIQTDTFVLMVIFNFKKILGLYLQNEIHNLYSIIGNCHY
jgi:hypothetical protein